MTLTIAVPNSDNDSHGDRQMHVTEIKTCRKTETETKTEVDKERIKYIMIM